MRFYDSMQFLTKSLLKQFSDRKPPSPLCIFNSQFVGVLTFQTIQRRGNENCMLWKASTNVYFSGAHLTMMTSHLTNNNVVNFKICNLWTAILDFKILHKCQKSPKLVVMETLTVMWEIWQYPLPVSRFSFFAFCSESPRSLFQRWPPWFQSGCKLVVTCHCKCFM